MLRDLLADELAPDIQGAVRQIARADADILVLSGIDYDHGRHALGALRDRLNDAGVLYPHTFSQRPNAGLATQDDLDGDGRARGPRDAQGYGEFAGQGGLAVLSRYPVTGWVDHSENLWRDLPGALILESDAGWKAQRLSSNAHWELEVEGPWGPLTLWVFHATPPVFDGPEDRNGRRNHDEAAFWLRRLDLAPPRGAFVLLGDANLDPLDGDGRPEAILALLDHPLLQDVEPRSEAGAVMAAAEGGANLTHRGDPTLDTANWADDENGPGNLRVDYVLPSRHWRADAAGIAWTRSDGDADGAPRHGLVWVDLVPGGAAQGLDRIGRAEMGE